MLFLQNTFTSGRIWLDHKIHFFIAHNFRLSTLTGNEHIFQEKHLKILKRSTHTWPPFNNVPLIPGAFYSRCSTHIWTPILLMFHSYLDPILQNVPLLPGPHLDKCSTHVWTPSYKMFHSYPDPPILLTSKQKLSDLVFLIRKCTNPSLSLTP